MEAPGDNHEETNATKKNEGERSAIVNRQGTGRVFATELRSRTKLVSLLANDSEPRAKVPFRVFLDAL